MDEKKKVLFSFVGNRDPYSIEKVAKVPDEKASRMWGRLTKAWQVLKGQETSSEDIVKTEGGVLTACRWLKPDIVYLFPSSKEKAAETGKPANHTEDNANKARDIIMSQLGIKECIVMPLMTDNPTNTNELYTCLRINMRKIFNSLTRKYPDEKDAIQNKYELFFIMSSGTPDMRASASVFLPSLPYEFQYYRCIPPKHANEKDRVVPLTLELAEEMLLLKTIESNVNGYYFHSAIENCDRLSSISILKMRRERAAELSKFFAAYEQIDMMQYEAAYDHISRAAKFYEEHKDEYLEKQPILPVESIGDVLKRQAEFIEGLRVKVRIADEGEDVNNLIDLYYNMERAYTRGNYVDVLARFWRLREGMMNYRMLVNHHLDRRNLKKPFWDKERDQQRKANYERLMNSSYSSMVNWDNGWVRNEIDAMVALLTEFFDDGELREFEGYYKEQLRYLQTSRNQTIVAHGMLPVSKKTADICINLGKEIIKLIPGGQEVFDSYPFKRENMQEVLNLLKYI